MDLQGKTAAELGRAIGAQELDPVELATAFLDAAELHEFGDRIYARLTRDRAISEAAAARDRAISGQRLSALDGVPISWKDLVDSAGVATEGGTALLEGRVPDQDAEVLRNATAAGLVCIGKTHLSELAFSGLGYNPVTATTPCVNNHAAVSGGSSSGAAGSVAFGIAAAAIGSDTGGSVRVPAAWNDLVGLKTTSGRLPLKGVVPLCARFDTVGPLTHSVEDASLILAALEGSKPVDLRGVSLQGVRLASLQTSVRDDLAPAVAAAYQSACERLQSAGAEIVAVEFAEIQEALELAPVLFAPEAYGTWKSTIEASPDKMFPEILERFRSGANVLASDYIAAWQAIDDIRAKWSETFAGFDAVLCPTTPNLPPNLADIEKHGDAYKTANLMTLRNTRVGNLMGLSALTLPTGVPSCGITLMGKAFGEEALLRVGAASEEALR
ncbi:MAG: amidase family protein [Paracoccaceae bacterium]|jgi:aspartyl-tRNA(Asn)/glutamyl-tRNA(Gln) amidotransferase subunit A|nr:amidase family protein [Paracoccaceae bacterium]